jgi:hypothetical protein
MTLMAPTRSASEGMTGKRSISSAAPPPALSTLRIRAFRCLRRNDRDVEAHPDQITRRITRSRLAAGLGLPLGWCAAPGRFAPSGLSPVGQYCGVAGRSAPRLGCGQLSGMMGPRPSQLHLEQPKENAMILEKNPVDGKRALHSDRRGCSCRAERAERRFVGQNGAVVAGRWDGPTRAGAMPVESRREWRVSLRNGIEVL